MKTLNRSVSRRQTVFATSLVVLIILTAIARWWIRENSSHVSPLRIFNKVTPVTAFNSLPDNPTALQYAERIHALGRDLALAEQGALIDWYCAVKPAHLSNDSWRWLVNDSIEILSQQNQPTARISDSLVGIFSNPRNDVVLRDYALQHMATRLQSTTLGDSLERDPKKREQMLLSLLNAAKQWNETFSGTALQGLHRVILAHEAGHEGSSPNAQSPLSVDGSTIQQVAVGLAISSNGSDLARITALQVCAQRGYLEALPVARDIAADVALSPSLRLSAIALLGQIGGSEDIQTLENVRTENQPRLMKAVRPALQKIALRTTSRENTRTP